MAKSLATAAAVMLVALCVLYTPGKRFGTPVGIADAQGIRGGACGNLWNTIEDVYCDSTGTRLCNGMVEYCSNVSFSTLVAGGAGMNCDPGGPIQPCNLCSAGAMNCGTAKQIESSNPINCE
jgi:hypothetical protein